VSKNFWIKKAKSIWKNEQCKNMNRPAKWIQRPDFLTFWLRNPLKILTSQQVEQTKRKKIRNRLTFIHSKPDKFLNFVETLVVVFFLLVIS
jgi:hypothetical protein